jgi:cell division septation protein DedD
MLDRDEREHGDTEITLGTATLLSIFFGLVVVCGVFFGFGYSVGRRATTTPPAASTPADSSAAVDPHTGKPSAVQTALTTTTAPSAQASSSPAEASPAATQAAPTSPGDSRTVTVTEPDAAAPAKPAEPSAAAPSATALPAAGASRAMVQIAAVSHQEDADVLVSALRKRGYNVSVRTEPQDKLLHVQVGPFATRTEALIMKQKLQADGYNAIVK